MMSEQTTLTMAEQIDRARIKEGRSQRWLVLKLREAGMEMSDVRFSQKKNGQDTFNSEELTKLSELLGVTFSY